MTSNPEARKRWRDLPAWLQALLSAAAALQVGLLAAAQIDLTRRPAEQVRGGKLRWRLLSLVNVAGPILYFRYGRIRLDQRAGGTPGR